MASARRPIYSLSPMAAGCRLRLLEPIKSYFGISAALMRSSMSAGVTEYLGAIDTFYRIESGRTAGCGRAVLMLSVAVLSAAASGWGRGAGSRVGST